MCACVYVCVMQQQTKRKAEPSTSQQSDLDALQRVGLSSSGKNQIPQSVLTQMFLQVDKILPGYSIALASHRLFVAGKNTLFDTPR